MNSENVCVCVPAFVHGFNKELFLSSVWELHPVQVNQRMANLARWMKARSFSFVGVSQRGRHVEVLAICIFVQLASQVDF